MTILNRRLKRAVPDPRRPLVVMLHPAHGELPALIEVREKGRRSGPRISIPALHSLLVRREVDGRRAERAHLRRMRRAQRGTR